jgi:hypothetical protein
MNIVPQRPAGGSGIAGLGTSDRTTPRRTWVDRLLVATVALAGFLLALWYMSAYRASGGVPRFYQNEFAPAVMLTCGRGFVNADVGGAPAFGAFLYQKADRLQCSDVPATIRVTALNGLQGITRYLMMTVSLVWRVTGISWRSLDVLIAAFVAATAAAAFAALRFVCGRAVSLIVTFLWAVSPWHLQNVPHLRDYSKAPFFMFLLIAMGVAFVERRPRRLLALGIVFGVVQGVGFGMRTDVVLNFVPFLIVLLAAPSAGASSALTPRLACAAAAIGLFLIVSYPVLRSYAQDISLWHVVILGFTSPFDENLGIGFPRPAYALPYAYYDGYVDVVVRDYWVRDHPAAARLVMLTRPYDEACRSFVFELARTFPGDMMTRMAASVIRVLNFPFWQPEGYVPVGVSNPTLRSLWSVRGSLMGVFDGAGPWLMAAVVTLIGMEGLRYACIACLFLWIWAAYPAIEFQWRHIFQLEFLVLGAVAWGGTMLWRLVRRMPAGALPERVKTGLWSLATVAALVGGVGVAIGVARAIQIPRARALLLSYAGAPLDALPLNTATLPDGQVRLVAQLFASVASADTSRLPEVEPAMIAADFEADRCGEHSLVDATFRYEESDPALALDFSRRTTVVLSPATGPPTRLFFPAYAVNRTGTGGGWSRFVGVEVPAGYERCVRLWQVRDAASFPLLLPATLTSDWQDKLYQRLRFERAFH